MEQTKKPDLFRLTVTGMLVALEIVMAFTPVGYLKIGFLSVTFMTIPVIIGAVACGPLVGAILGLTFGVTSFVQCFGLDAFGTMLMSINPVATFVMCVVTRTLMGFLCGLVYQGLSKTKAPAGVKVGVSAFSAPFLNTAFFMPCLIVFFWKSEYIRGIASSLGAENILTFLVAMVGVNGVVEWVVCTAVGAAVALALLKAMPRMKKR